MDLMENLNDKLYAKMNSRLDETKKAIAGKLLKESTKPENLTFALDYIFERVETHGAKQLAEAINDSATHFGINATELYESVREAFYEESKGNELIEELVSICNNGKRTVTFDNSTSKVVNEADATSMLSFWYELTPENRIIMESDIKTSRTEFDKYLSAYDGIA